MNCRKIAAELPRQKNGKNPAKVMITIETSTYTQLELYWAIAAYRKQLVAKSFSDRTFRLWRQKLKIVPDDTGLYWESDLERLKDATRRVSQGQTLDQIQQMMTNREKEYADY